MPCHCEAYEVGCGNPESRGWMYLLRRLILLSLFILALVTISFYGGVISYAFFFAVLLIPLLSLIYLLYVLHFSAVYQDVGTRNITAGEAVPYRFILSNEGHVTFTGIAVRLYSDYSSVTDVPDNRQFTLFPRDRVTFDTMLTCRYRGEYEIGVRKLIITDFLGIFRLSYRMPSCLEAIVKPRIIRLERLDDIPEPAVINQSHQRQENNEPDLTVRDYIPGDSLTRIHWKSTAKSGELKVRNEVGAIKQKILLLADFERVSTEMATFMPLENQVLEQVIALLYYFARHAIPTELLFNREGLESRMVNDIKRFNSVYEELASVQFREKNTFDNMFKNASSHGVLTQSSLILMVIQRIDDELYSSLSQLSHTGKIVVVYIVTNEDISEYVRQNSERLRIIAM
jgi:hypothetical protein